MRGVGDMLLFRDREMGKAVTGFESRTVTAHEVSNSIIASELRSTIQTSTEKQWGAIRRFYYQRRRQ